MTGGRFSAVKGRGRFQRTVSNPPSGIPPGIAAPQLHHSAQPPHARHCSATGGKEEEKGGRVLPVNGWGGVERGLGSRAAPNRPLGRSRDGSTDGPRSRRSPLAASQHEMMRPIEAFPSNRRAGVFSAAPRHASAASAAGDPSPSDGGCRTSGRSPQAQTRSSRASSGRILCDAFASSASLTDAGAGFSEASPKQPREHADGEEEAGPA
jgi:hypothetical protein